MRPRTTPTISTSATPWDQHRPNPGPTREKLLNAAGEVFAERGFYKATIREICHRAGANVAAVNYTFGDKLALYTEVLRQSVRAPETAQLTAALDTARSPEEVLHKVIFARLQSLCGGERPDWGFRIIMHEFLQPTPAMAQVVEEGMRPVYKRVLKAVGELLGLSPDHEKTRLCNNSIIGQVLFYAHSRPVLSRLQPELSMTPEQLERIAEHIFEFSMASLMQMSPRVANRDRTTLKHGVTRSGTGATPVTRSDHRKTRV